MLDAPPGFTLGALPGVTLRSQAAGPLDVILLFTADAAALARRFPAAHRALAPDGGLWVAWPKKSSGLVTDLDFDTVQRNGLTAGLVDNKSCAVDATWSGLRFVYRLSDRPPRARGTALQAPAPAEG